MVNQNDDFYDSDTSLGQFRLNNSNGFLPPSPPDSPVVKSPEKKMDSNHVASEETSSMLKSRKKRKAAVASYAPDPRKIWSKDDELVILKGIIDYRNETGVDYLSGSGAFFSYIKDDIDAKVSKDQLMNKINKLKKKFQTYLAKKPCFTNSHDSESFDLSMAIWGKDRGGSVDGNSDKAKGTKSKVRAFVEHEAMKNGEHDGSSKGDSLDKLPLENIDKNMENETGGKESDEIEAVKNTEPGNVDGSAKGNPFDDKLPSENVNKRMKKRTGGKESEEIEAVTNAEPGNVDGSAKGDSCVEKLPSENVNKRMKKGTGGKEREEDDVDLDMCALQDALESTVFYNFGTYTQKLMLKELRSLSANKRKELSGEWKSLLVQEALLKSKKYAFSAKLADAVLHD